LLADCAHAPIVPALITGTFDALPPHARMLRCAKIRVAFGRLIPYTNTFAPSEGALARPPVEKAGATAPCSAGPGGLGSMAAPLAPTGRTQRGSREVLKGALRAWFNTEVDCELETANCGFPDSPIRN
jgi:hypothetical protein